MINKVSFLNVFTEKKDNIMFRCPSCGFECNENDNKCSDCSYDLKDYKRILFSHYSHFNKSINLISDGDYFNALLSIVKFLAFEPNNEQANEIYVYLLYKNNKKEEYEYGLKDFEERFQYSKFIVNTETDGIEKYIVPKKVNINNLAEVDCFSELKELYLKSKFKTLNEILELESGFYDIVKFYSTEKNGKKIVDYFDKRFLQFLSKFEISIEQHDTKLYDELTDDIKNKIEIISEINKPKMKEGTLVTIAPAIYLRSKLITKEKAAVVKKNKGWK